LDFVQNAISARLTHGDLVAADQALESDPSVLGVRLILVKQILLSCANVADLELISRGLYRAHPEIGELITPYRRNFEFAKYIRNIAVGHVNPALSRKAIEWRPELNSVLATPKPGGDAFLGFAILETAINTFVDGDSHRIFEGDTDLGYPPDLTRFLSFLGNTAHVGMAYCEALAVAAVRRAELPEFDANLSDLAVRAGKTDFKFITRKGESGGTAAHSFRSGIINCYSPHVALLDSRPRSSGRQIGSPSCGSAWSSPCSADSETPRSRTGFESGISFCSRATERR
jgi:hypothetical protein